MAGRFYLLPCLFFAVITQHRVQTTKSEPLTEDVRMIMASLKEIEGGITVLSRQAMENKSCPKSEAGKGLGSIVAQLGTELQNARLQLQASQTELNATKAELRTTKTELNTQLQNIQKKLQDFEEVLRASQTKFQANQTALQATKEEIQASKKEFRTTQQDLESQLQNIKTELLRNRTALPKQDQGSTFVRWGRTSCPANTTLVYTGIAGGKYYASRASGSNRLCLTPSPEFDSTVVSEEQHGKLYGATYYHIAGHSHKGVPCSVCLAAQSATIMIAGTFTCPAGWTSQYHGHLASETEMNIAYATEYVCLDSHVEKSDGLPDWYLGGPRFSYVKAECGSLGCRQSANKKAVTCVVCSK